MKTIRVDDEAYQLLKGHKVSPADSFSDVVKRHFGETCDFLEKTAGTWSDMTDEEVRKLREQSRREFGTTANPSS